MRNQGTWAKETQNLWEFLLFSYFLSRWHNHFTTPFRRLCCFQQPSYVAICVSVHQQTTSVVNECQPKNGEASNRRFLLKLVARMTLDGRSTLVPTSNGPTKLQFIFEGRRKASNSTALLHLITLKSWLTQSTVDSWLKTFTWRKFWYVIKIKVCHKKYQDPRQLGKTAVVSGDVKPCVCLAHWQKDLTPASWPCRIQIVGTSFLFGFCKVARCAWNVLGSRNSPTVELWLRPDPDMKLGVLGTERHLFVKWSTYCNTWCFFVFPTESHFLIFAKTSWWSWTWCWLLGPRCFCWKSFSGRCF